MVFKNIIGQKDTINKNMNEEAKDAGVTIVAFRNVAIKKRKLGYKNVSTARASVSRIRNSGRSHAHKIQAAVSMEQRAKAAGKSKEAAVFRRYINANKKGKK